jgi:prefoldin subunit 5
LQALVFFNSKERVMKVLLSVVFAGVIGLTGCGAVYYGAMEKMGVHKRDIMVDRVKKARDTQDEAKQQFLTAMEHFKSVVHFQGGDLEKEYDRLKATLQKTEAEAAQVRKRIRAIEDVSSALFKEWQAEIEEYSSHKLREASRRRYDATKIKYAELIDAMKKAEARLEPALVPLRDQVLFMKHNLNAKAIASLNAEVGSVQMNVDSLVTDMEAAIAKADSFIESLKAE